MDVNNIDWSSVWREGVIFFGGYADKATSWDAAAARWNAIHHKDDYGAKVLKRIRLNPKWTVLDVGCGAGLLAVPMAKKCRHVTALDASAEMLKYLSQNAAQEGVTNIKAIHRQFETVEVGKDIEQHDVVVASRSMGWEHDLKRFLKNMDLAAKKRAYVIWGADDRPFDIGLYKAIGRPYGETRTYIVIYNLLYQLGIRANIEIFQTKPTAMSYKSADEAVSELGKRFERMGMNRELSEEEKAKLKKYLQETLKKTSDGTVRFVGRKTARNTLIWWKK